MAEIPHPNDDLGRQPDPIPPAVAATPPPSIALYASLTLFAFILIAAAFTLGSNDWPGFFLNLATEIVGAIIILLLVDRRFRRQDVNRLRGLQASTRSALTALLTSSSTEIQAYARVFAKQVKNVAFPFYLERPKIEDALNEHLAEGVLIIGKPNIGKTTLLHKIARQQARKVSKDPKSELVPVLVPIAQWHDESAQDILHETMDAYSPISKRTFNKLLKKGKLLCLFDGLDESPNMESIINKLQAFQTLTPRNAMVITLHPKSRKALESFGLHELVLSALPKEESDRLRKLRRQQRKPF